MARQAWKSTGAASLGSVNILDGLWAQGGVGADAPVIRIGVYGCTVPTVAGGCWRDRAHLLYLQWLEHVSRNPILGRYRVQLLEAPLPLSPSDNRTELILATEAMLDAPGGPPGFIVLPVGNTVFSDSIMPTLEARGIVAMAVSPTTAQYQCDAAAWRSQVGCTAPNTRRWRYANCILNAGSQFFASFLGMLRVEQVHRLAIITVRSPFYDEVIGGIRYSAQQYGMEISFMRELEPSEGSIARVTVAAVEAVIAELASIPEERAPEVLFITSFTCDAFIRAMRKAHYIPKAVAAIRCVDTDQSVEALGKDIRYVTGPGQWSETIVTPDFTEDADTQPWARFPVPKRAPHINGSQSVPKSSALQFAEAYRKVYDLPEDATPSYADVAWMACFTALEAAIWLANSSDPALVQDALNTLYQPSFFGTLAFNRFGLNDQKHFVTLQRDVDGVMHLIDPPISATARFVYPIPSWDEREYRSNVMGSTVELVFFGVMLACMLLTLFLLSYLYWHRRRQVVSAAGLPFYFVMGLGCLLAYASILTWPVDNNLTTCRSRVWLWSGAFYCLVAPILANSFRIACIASLGLYQKTRITTAHTRALAVAIMLPQLLVNIVWSSVAPFDARLVTPDPLRPGLGFTLCEIPNDVGRVCLYISLALMFLALLVVCVLAWRIRHVGTLFNDARPLGLAMYLFTLVSVLVVGVHAALPQQRRSDVRVLFAVRSGAVLLAYQTSIALLFLRRILHKNQSVTSTATRTAHANAAAAAAAAARAHKARARMAEVPLAPLGYDEAPFSIAQGGHMTRSVQQGEAGEAGVPAIELSTGAAQEGPTADSAPPVSRQRPPHSRRVSDIAEAHEGVHLAVLSPPDRRASPSPSSSSSLLDLGVPRFHLPPRDEYITWSQSQLVALLDEAASTLGGLQAIMEEERRQQEAREQQRQAEQTQAAQRGAQPSPARAPSMAASGLPLPQSAPPPQLMASAPAQAAPDNPPSELPYSTYSADGDSPGSPYNSALAAPYNSSIGALPSSIGAERPPHGPHAS